LTKRFPPTVTFPLVVTVAADNVPVKVGDAEKTTDPEPVSSVKAAAKFDEEGVAKKVATLPPRPDTPVEIGNPVQLVNVPDVGVPKSGVTRVGDVACTLAPVPVSSVNNVAKFADDGVAKNVAAPAASPVTLLSARLPLKVVAVIMPVATIPLEVIVTALPTTILVAVAEPNTGVTRVGDVACTLAPVPVSSVNNVAKFADDGVAKNAAAPAANPETPDEIGNPVQFVNVPDAGVPNTGVTRVGLVANTSAPVPVSSVTAAAKFADDGVVKNEVTPVPAPVSVPALVVTEAKLNVPDPFVTSACPLLPSALGSVKVVIPERLSGAFRVMK